MQGWRGLLAALSMAVLAGCAALPHVESPPNYAAALAPGQPLRAEITAVPFHAQEAYQCGPAALAMVFGNAGIERSPEQLAGDVYLPARQGSLQIEMLAATRRAGLVPYQLAPRADALMREIAAGNPVIVLQNLRFDAFPQWHYAVVVGYDLPADDIILRSGGYRRLVLPVTEFDRSWAKGERWAFVALPPERLPATATEADYLATVADLERVAPAAAERAYQSALDAWPASLVARLALGNAAYRRHDATTALEHYRRASSEHPDSADAWNNLAQVLHESGRHADALAAAERAVSLGGPRLATYASTLATIRAARPH